MDWYYAENNEQRGPVDEETFNRLRESGSIGPATLVWQAGMSNWARLATLAPETVPAERTGTSPGQTDINGDLVVCGNCHTWTEREYLIPAGEIFVCPYCRDTHAQRLTEGLPDRDFELAPFWKRLVGYLIDYLILQVISGVMLGVAMAFGSGSSAMAEVPMLINLASNLIPLLYAVIFLGTPALQATPGMMIFKIRIIRPDGEPVSYARATGRYVASFLSAIALLLGYFMMLWDEENRTFHDRVAGTLVVSK